MKEIKLTRGEVALVDDEDYERVNALRWYCGNNWYAAREHEGKVLLMHNFIIGIIEAGLEVDHIDRNPLNNTQANLRVVTRSVNQHNSYVKPRGASQYRGVSWHKQAKRWAAQIWVDGLKYSLGLYSTEEEAARAYNKTALEFYGEHVQLNDVDNLGGA